MSRRSDGRVTGMGYKFIVLYYVHACCVINLVRWAWWEWELSGWLTTLLQCFDAVGWVFSPITISSLRDQLYFFGRFFWSLWLYCLGRITLFCSDVFIHTIFFPSFSFMVTVKFLWISLSNEWNSQFSREIRYIITCLCTCFCGQEALQELKEVQQIVPKESLVYFLTAKV